VGIEPLFFKSGGLVVDRFHEHHINRLAGKRKGVNSAEINGFDPPKVQFPRQI
jgi:hypothetical protein